MKITIDNEEVLCDKNFTIEEEMLNTSSVILNNVYPATWEQDKDYVSRFYYPKDYSKCKIFNEIVHPTTREDIEGTSFSITADLTKQYQVQTLKGQTSQSGTPTPTSPQPINITTGRQVVSVCGNNLLNTNTFVKGRIDPANGQIQHPDGITDFSTTNNSITFTSNATWRGVASDFIPITTGTYYFKMSVSTTSSNVYAYVDYYDSNYNYISRLGNNGYVNGDTKTWLLNLNVQNAKFIRIHFEMQQVGTTTITNPMLDESNATYEEYKGNDYEINLGKNLCDYQALNLVTNGNGTTSMVNNYYDVIIDTLGVSSLYVSGDFTLLNSNTLRVGGYSVYPSTSATGTRYNITTNSAFNTNNHRYIMFCFLAKDGHTIDEIKNSFQIEKGNQFTGYSAYKPPIYLGKIGTYQDYIFKNTTENPLYDSNLEEGQWYIHKEIGRVVLNGSEASWSYDATNSVFINNSSIINGQYAVQNGYSNYFKNVVNANITNNYYAGQNLQNGEFSFRVGTKDRLYLKNTSYTNVNDFKTWLSTHNVEVYYILNTPTNTLIEDEELINQLNSIELLEGLNNVSVSSPYLPFIMSLMYNYQEGYTEEDMLFCGVVENTGNISLNPRHPHYCNLQVLDFKTFLSEGETLDFVIYEKTILEAINQVIGTISDYGFILGNVNILHSDDVIGAYSTKDKTAYDVFNYIADITQSRWTTRMVDENTVAIDFYDPSLMPQGTAIDYTQEWFCDNNIIDMSFSYSSRDYRNKQVMLSGEVYANIETTEIIVADGYQTQFNTTGKIGYVSSLLLNGNPATIITKEEYDLGYEGDFVYQPGNTYFESVNLVSTGAIITIVYFAIIEGREVVLNQEEISRVSEMIDRKGVIARYENRNDATTTQELQAIGQSYIKYKGSPEVSLKVESLENIWNIGERVSFTAPLTELTTEYMVKKKTIQYIPTQDNIFYSFELSSNFNSETEINYFDNQRSKMMGNIGAGEFISRNIDIENTANVIFYDLEVNEVEVDGDSTLQSELQTPLGVE